MSHSDDSVIGQSIGPYTIVARLGAGGMGEVYRARDAKLNREIALKILPDSFARDPDRRMRFAREAQTLAALDHPNIAQIYGFDDSGGRHALVMELVEGEDLSERLARGAIPLDEALPLARQIAAALEAAHEQGIIHRDLKPANVKVRADGRAKVLDFGLAKPPSSGQAGGAATVTSPAMTAAGTILGTAAYMAPEQARGRPVDRRADVWAFGALLFEMLSGSRAFDGADITDTLASVLRSEPDWSRLPADLPDAIRTLIRRCLEKDPAQRLSHLSAATFVLSEAPALPPARPAAADRAGGQRRVLLVGVAMLLTGAAITAAALRWLAPRDTPPPRPPIRFTVAAETGGESWRATSDRALVLSRDARTLVYRGVAPVTGFPQLYLRSLDTLEPRPLPNTALARAPFLSPDAAWVGFFYGSTLRTVPAAGGPPVTVATMNLAGSIGAGASWGDDGTIVFAYLPPAQPKPPLAGLMSVPAAGGEPTILTTVDQDHGEAAHTAPFVLPGARGILFTVQKTGRPLFDGRLMVLDRATGQRREIAASGSGAEYVAGRVIYADTNGQLQALPFDLARLEATGPATPLPEQVHVPANGQPLFSTAAVGALAYVAGARSGEPDTSRTLVWVDRQGRETPTDAPPRSYAVARLSPDGTQVAVDVRQQENDIWIWSTARASLTKLSRGPTLDIAPLWTPDGRRIIWSSSRETANPMLYWQAADGTGAPERLGERGLAEFAGSVTPDGQHVLFYQGGNLMNAAIQKLRLRGGHDVETVLRGAGLVLTPEVSPDGRWLAYSSDESGQQEIYVRPYPDIEAGRWQISSQGGTRPAWNRNGRELFFLDASNRLSVAPIAVNGGTFAPGPARRLLERAYYPGFTTRGLVLRGYDVSADGDRFLMIKGDENADGTTLVHLAINWSPP